MKNKMLILILFSIVTARAQENVLDYYIRQGLESNLSLQQKQLSYEKSLAILKEAKGMFFPDISFNARYSVAEGGRVIDFPIGDIMNPVYTTLNQIIQQDKFPMIQNEEVPFLRPTEQETKISLVQPIIQPEILYNYRIREDLSQAEAVGVDVYKRELVAEIKNAYLNYLQSLASINIYEESLELVQENLRTNKSLYHNDKVTIDVVYRAEAEVSKVQQMITEAEKNRESSAAYFNFLLNKPLESTIDEMSFEDFMVKIGNIKHYEEQALKKREELIQLQHMKDATKQSIKLNKSAYYPSLIAAVDYGIQGEEYRFTDEDDYVLASLVMKWNLFKGKQKSAKVQQARIDAQILDQKNQELEQQINLQVVESYYDLIASGKDIEVSKDEAEAARKAFRLVNKKYKQGQASLVEFMDARNSMTQSEINHNIKKYEYLKSYANFERITGQFEFNQ